VIVCLGEMQDYLCQVVVLHVRSELGDPVGEQTPGLRCGSGGLHLQVCVTGHGVIITLWQRRRHTIRAVARRSPAFRCDRTPYARDDDGRLAEVLAVQLEREYRPRLARLQFVKFPADPLVRA
jgi:hypothetical protein